MGEFKKSLLLSLWALIAPISLDFFAPNVEFCLNPYDDYCRCLDCPDLYVIDLNEYPSEGRDKIDLEALERLIREYEKRDPYGYYPD